MISKNPYSKAHCQKPFLRTFRAILYNRKLTWGAKCFALSLLDVPPGSKLVLAKLARKLGVTPATAFGWKKQLLASKVSVREENPSVS